MATDLSNRDYGISAASGEGREMLFFVLLGLIFQSIRRLFNGLVKIVTVSVDYDRPIKDSVSAGLYDCIETEGIKLSDKNFPIHNYEKGVKKIILRILRFRCGLFCDGNPTEFIQQKIEKMGCRSATTRELLAFGEKHPGIQRKCEIVALDYIFIKDKKYVAILSSNGGRMFRLIARGIGLGNNWNSNCCFLVVEA